MSKEPFSDVRGSPTRKQSLSIADWMMFVDYDQSAEHHQYILILVTSLGKLLQPAQFDFIFKKISESNVAAISSQDRVIRIRYVRGYSLENNEWGQFQTFRRLLGLICVAECDSEEQLAEVTEQYKLLKKSYVGTLYDSRLIIFGMDVGNGKEENEDKDQLPSVLLYKSPDDLSIDLGAKLYDLITSLFWVLESKRLDRCLERHDRTILPLAPFEKKDFVGIDTDSRTYRKRCHGRIKKQLADLSLQTGLANESLLHYQTASDILRSSNDWLWLAGCLEGICASSVALSMPKPVAGDNFVRNASSFTEKRPAGAASKSSRGNLNGLDLAEGLSKSLISPEQIISKYKEAILHYSKYKHAALIEIEACLKACRYLISQKKYHDASEFLQNIVYINFQISDEDKILRYTTLSDLYCQIKMFRKASFFRRVGAMQCVAPHNSQPDWARCHQMLLQALHGYKLSLLASQHRENVGWPTVQLRVLHELVYSARRMNASPVAIRHLSLLLQLMLHHLTPQEREELCNVLQSHTALQPDSGAILRHPNVPALPPVPLTSFPKLLSIKAVPSRPHLQPHPFKPLQQKASPFIYSPLLSNRVQTESVCTWAVGDDCKVVLQLTNPLPVELKIHNLILETEGVEWKSQASQLSIAPAPFPRKLEVVGVPTARGKLKIIGYRFEVLGVTSFIRLSSDFPPIVISVVDALPRAECSVSLPPVVSTCSLTESEDVVASGSAAMMAGQSCECLVTLKNCGDSAIEMLTVSVQSKLSADVEKETFSWQPDFVDSLLPLAPLASLSFPIVFNATSDFLALPDTEGVGGGPRRRACSWYGYESIDLVDGTVMLDALVKLSYSGGDGYRAGFCRTPAIAASIQVSPSIVFTEWTVAPSSDPSEFLLHLTLLNVMDEAVQLDAAGLCVKLQPDQMQRLPFPLPRCPPGALPHLRSRPSALLAPSRLTYMAQADLQRFFRRFVGDRLRVRWKTCSEVWAEFRPAALSLERLKWDLGQLYHAVLPVPYIEVAIDSCAYRGPVEVAVAKPFSLHLLMTNNSGNCFVAPRLNCEIKHAKWNVDVGECFVLQGATSNCRQKLEADESLELDMQICLLVAGSYVLNTEVSWKSLDESLHSAQHSTVFLNAPDDDLNDVS